ncbi:MAG: T9SS type A sorting domain-containing protein [Bacteroidetes bacterium]|nr:T9SS type A sorting domain-containing protein [Bacteroidota bacterium]
MVIIRTTIFLLLFAALTTQSQTYITAGEVTGNWSPEGNPYIVEGDLIVSPEERLSIEPGVEVVFSGPYAIEVYGRIEALGTPADSIWFTVSDTSGFSFENYSGWYGIGFVGYGAITNEMSKFEYCNIEFSAGTGISCMHYNNLEINHSRISNNKEYGMNLMEFSDIQSHDLLIENNLEGGLALSFSAPQLTGFVIRNNGGSGISILGNSNGSVIATFTDGRIDMNNSNQNGGGMAIWEDAMVMITNVEITSNTGVYGGGMYASSGYITVNESLISFNESISGGGIYIENGTHLLMDYGTITHNSVAIAGGGVYNYDGNIAITRSTIADNIASESGGGLYFELYENGENTINSSIVWNNYPDAIMAPIVQPDVMYSDIMGGFEGIGNLDKDPLFAQPDNNDYQLTWVNYPFENAYTSPCIDSGDPVLALDPDGTTADMGAFYYQQEMFVTRIAESNWGTSLEVYPNPANNIIYLQGNEEISGIEITSLNGQIVKKIEAVNPGKGYQISELKQGIYLVRMHDGNGNAITKKLIKQ